MKGEKQSEREETTMRNIAILAILLIMGNIGMASVSFGSDTYGIGSMDMETDTDEDASRITGEGETSIGLSLAIDWANQTSFKGLSTDKGRFKIKTPEYSFDMKGLNLEAMATTTRQTEQADSEKLETKLIDNETYQEYLDTYKRTATMELSATGNGTVEESLIISTGKRRNKELYSASLNGTMLDIKRKLSMSGLDLRTRLEKLEQREVLIHEN